jgi:uncharacterized protein (TIGR00369 family)
MDDSAARQAFEIALQSYKPGFETFFLARFIGLEFSYDEDTCTIRFPVQDFMFNPQGSLHGGVIAFVADVAMGHLIKHSVGLPGLTLEMKLQFLRAVRGPHARCESHFLRKGSSVCFLEARLFDAHDEVAAVATSTWRVIQPRPAAGRINEMAVTR